MKTQDLRIGNVVNYLSSEGDLLTNVIDIEDLKWLLRDEKGFNLVHSPIELTEEILLKCGFEKIGVNYRLLTIGTSFFEFCIYSGFRFRLLEGMLSIKYLHQLQNLYFVLAQTELEITGNIHEEKL